MGIETAILVGAVVTAGAEAGKAFSQIKSANAQEQALDMQAKQAQINYQQKTLDNYDRTLKLIDAQKAAMSVRGVAYSSPSFNAIQRESINITSRKQKNFDIENSLAQLNIENEKENVKNSLYAQLFGDVASLANFGLNAYSKMPTKG